MLTLMRKKCSHPLLLGLWLGLSALIWAAGPAVAAPPSYLVGEYKLPAVVDASVASEMQTELWASVYRPSRAGRFPLLVFLHGNHGTCGIYDERFGVRFDERIDYSYSGTCPEGWQPTPNHRGYDYLATQLAAAGYVVVSINANRGVNGADGVRGDFGLNLRRGRLVLRHLQQLAQWNNGRTSAPAGLGFGLKGLIDFGHVGLLGHSRGGEGMRAALAQYRDKGSAWPRRIGKVNFEALFEIGPVDGQTSRTLDAEGVAWNVLLPGCDGDVADLQGVRPLDRMIMRRAESAALPKSSIVVYGANHNFYNTEWQWAEAGWEPTNSGWEWTDSGTCIGQPTLFPPLEGSEAQRQTAVETVIPFMLAHVGPAKKSAEAELFDPSRPLPPELAAITSYARGQAADLRPSASFVIDDFTRKTGRSSRGAANAASLLAAYAHGNAGANHDVKKQRAALVEWTAAGGYLQVNASDKSVALPPGKFKSLEFRVKLECYDDLCTRDFNPFGDIDFSIRLANGDGTLSAPVQLSSVASVHHPVKVAAFEGYGSVFQTVRIPLASFTGASMQQFRGVCFSFDVSARGRISLGNVRLVQVEAGSPASAAGKSMAGQAPPAAGGPAAAAGKSMAGPAPSAAGSPPVLPPERNEVVAVRRGVYAPGGEPGASAEPASLVTEIELASTRTFPVSGALPELFIGDKRFTLSRFSPGRLNRIVFLIDEAEYRLLPPSADMKVVIGARPVWLFGTFLKR